MSLILHMGTGRVERNALSQAELPVATATHQPIAHDYFVNLVQDKLEDRGLRVMEEAHGLNPAGSNYFGMFKLAPSDLVTRDFDLVVGMRNSHVKRFGAGVVAGANVMVCDNLSFSGDVKAVRKHTSLILDFLPELIGEALGKFVNLSEIQTRRFEAYKQRELKTYEAEHLMIEMLRRGVINAHRLPKLVEQWDNPDHLEFANTGRSAWRMFNAATEALKGTNVNDVARKTTKLHTLTDEVVELDPSQWTAA